MSRPVYRHKPYFVILGLATLASAWWGCAAESTRPLETDASSSSSSGSGGSSSSSTSGGIGGDTNFGDGGTEEDAACVATAAMATHVQLDMIFLIDRSGSMSGPKWMGTTSALTTFFNDPASVNIGAGLLYFPNNKPDPCVNTDYQVLDVPISALPGNAFALTNSMPADATGGSTPTFGALMGALQVATAYQDAHPTHKVVLVLATDGDPNACGLTTIDDIANLAKSARSYNGVVTYVIGVQGSTIANLNKIAVAGGTTAAYDVTNDILEFSAKMKEIRGAALGCEFEIPPPPNGEELDPNKVNFSYTPKGVGMSKILLKALDANDCQGGPGWYYDNNGAPTKIILCPASCTTVQADNHAKVEALFGCKSILK